VARTGARSTSARAWEQAWTWTWIGGSPFRASGRCGCRCSQVHTLCAHQVCRSIRRVGRLVQITTNKADNAPGKDTGPSMPTPAALSAVLSSEPHDTDGRRSDFFQSTVTVQYDGVHVRRRTCTLPYHVLGWLGFTGAGASWGGALARNTRFRAVACPATRKHSRMVERVGWMVRYSRPTPSSRSYSSRTIP
jgi:hypothetical protein